VFGFGFVELLIVSLLLMVVVGIGRFPLAARQVGRFTGLFQRYRKQWQLLKRILRLG